MRALHAPGAPGDGRKPGADARMSGTLRFFLAVAVVVSHLVDTDYTDHLGHYAVLGFFVLSAFAVTAALHTVYALDLKRFAASRLLRIAPLYVVACALTALAIGLDPDDAADFMPRWALPHTTLDVVENFALLPSAFGGLAFRYIEPAWSLAVEAIMYAALFVGVGRSARGAALAMFAGVLYHGVHLAAGDPFEPRYFGVEAPLLSFGFGALLYFAAWRPRIERNRALAVAALALWAANFFAAGALLPLGFAEGPGFYLNIALAGAVVITQPALAGGEALRSVDALLGDLSYPIFLVQWLGGFGGYVLLGESVLRGWPLALAAAAPILIMAIALTFAQRRFVEPMRQRLRAPGAGEAGTAPSFERASV